MKARDFEDTFDTIIENQTIQTLILNLKGVLAIDSSALGKIVEIHKKLQKRQGQLILCNLSQKIKTIFVSTHLDQEIIIHSTEEDALATARESGS